MFISCWTYCFFISKISKKYLRILISILLGIIGYILTIIQSDLINFKELFWSIEIVLVAIPFYMTAIEIVNIISKEKLENIVLDNKKHYDYYFNNLYSYIIFYCKC